MTGLKPYLHPGKCNSNPVYVCMQEKEERLVEKDVLAVKVKHCRDALVAKVDEVLLLEEEHAQLQKEFEAQRNTMAVSCPCWLPTCASSLSLFFGTWPSSQLFRQSC